MEIDKPKYSGFAERKIEIVDKESMEAFKEGIPEIVKQFDVHMAVRYWDAGAIQVDAMVMTPGSDGVREVPHRHLSENLLPYYSGMLFLKGAREVLHHQLSENFTAETPSNIYRMLDHLAGRGAYKAHKEMRLLRAEKAPELETKIKDALYSEVEELIVG